MRKLLVLLISLSFTLISYSKEFVEGEVLIELKENVLKSSGISTQNLIFPLKVKDPSVRMKKLFSQNKTHIFLIKSDIYSTQELIDLLKNNPYVKVVNPNYKIRPLNQTDPPIYTSNYYWWFEKIHAYEAWDLTTGSNDVVIAVLDTGIDYTHPDLSDSIWRNEAECNGADNEDDDGNGYIDDCIGYDMHDNDNDPMDFDGHGTHVTGIVEAVGKGIKILPCKIFNDNGEGDNVLSAAIECLNYIINLKKKGVNIVASNNSWAAYPGIYLGDALRSAIQESINAGILFITAAGNEGTNNDIEPVYPCSYELDNDGIICVTATDENDNLPFYSNFGSNSVDIAAPGDSIYSTLPTLLGSYGTETGTSMAAPFVSGAIGLLKSYEPSLSWKDVKARILMNVDILQSLNGKILTQGRLNLYASLTNPVKLLTEKIGIVDENNLNITVTPANNFEPDNDEYLLVEDPLSLKIEIDNDIGTSSIDLKFKLLTFDPFIKPAVCFENDNTCYILESEFYSISTTVVNPYINVYLEDNGPFDTDNELGKISVNLAFVKPKNIDNSENSIVNDSNNSLDNSGGGCTLSNRNDYSVVVFLVSFLLLLFFRRIPKSA